MLLRYCLSDFEIVPAAPIITGITFALTPHMRCISITRPFYIIIIIIILWRLGLFQGHGLLCVKLRGNWYLTKWWWEPHAQSAHWRVRLSLFARHLVVNLSGMGPPAARLSPAQPRSQCGVLRRQISCQVSIPGHCYRLQHCDCCKVPN
jgi:hypothetical protein